MTTLEHHRPPVFACPVCEEPLTREGQSFLCPNKHVFDVAKEGYVNLLLAQHRHSKDPGYNKEMITGRRDFFDAGHYERLADEVADTIRKYLPSGSSVVLDAGCGEGYYLRRLRALLAANDADGDVLLVGTDISKHGVRVAARRDPQGLYAVAGTFRIPVLPDSVDVLLTHFSPVSAVDFRKVVKPGGIVLVGGPGRLHLHSLKELLYETPNPHEPDDQLAGQDGFEPITTHTIRYPLHLEGPGQVANLLLMTPYNWSVSEEQRQRLISMESFDTEVDVEIRAYRRLGATPAGSDTQSARMGAEAV
ncbi:23S rRNA (guanine(745)-N(1))-methyltransferase [Myceligenerans halotolerans]